jgi:hypothetical protein
MPENNPLLSALEKAFTAKPTLPNPTLDPLPASSTSRAAIRRCRAARKRAYDICLADGGDNSMNRVTAESNAAPAYRATMPALDSVENIRDFIACTAHGILIGAIPTERSGQLLYAAQVALGLQQFQLKASGEPQKRRTPIPSPEKQPDSEPQSNAS